MFKEILQEVVDGTQGGLAGLLMDQDGIAIDQYARGDDAPDIETLGMEYSAVLKSVVRAGEMLEAGKTDEIAVKTEHMTTLLRLITEEYFVAVAIHPQGNLGKARFLLRTRAQRLRDNL